MPQGRQFALTWSIPDDFGGMTAAMLHRSAAFARLGGVPVDVLTFDARPDTPRLEQELRGRGVLADGVRVLNLYDWLREHPLPGGSLRLDRDVFTPLDRSEATELQASGDVVMSAIRRDSSGRMLQIDHYRDDGTLVLSDRRDTRSRGTLGGRSIVLCGPDGRPVRSWRRIWPLYAAWLDALTADRPSFMIVDSKTVARFMLTYRRQHVVTAHVVHGSHRAGAQEGHPIRSSRREVFEHLDAFDLVAVLSRRQAADIARTTGDRRQRRRDPERKPGLRPIRPRSHAIPTGESCSPPSPRASACPTRSTPFTARTRVSARRSASTSTATARAARRSSGESTAARRCGCTDSTPTPDGTSPTPRSSC